MLIDTHCHLTDDYCATGDVAAVIKRARAANVKALVCPSADPADIQKTFDLAGKYDNVFCTLGIHPEYADKYSDDDIGKITKLCEHSKVLGIGEIGLDYHYCADTKKQQIELFEKQIEIARRARLPLAIHTREAEDDTARILTEYVHGLPAEALATAGVMHCYTSSWDLAKTMLDRGFYFSASGIITFKNSDALRETFSKIPTDRIVIETDSPYCAPAPYRGKQCEPFMVAEVAKTLAAIKNLQLSELEIILEQNTKNLYPKWHAK